MKKNILVWILVLHMIVSAKEMSVEFHEPLELKTLLYEEYLANYSKKNELLTAERKYYLSSSLKNFYKYKLEEFNLKKTVEFFNELNKEEIKNKKDYIEAFYIKKKLIKMKVVSDNLYNRVTIVFDNNQKIRLIDLDYHHKVMIYKYDNLSNSTSLNCYKSSKECIIGFEQLPDRLKKLDADTFNFYDREIDKFLTKGEYISKIMYQLLWKKYQPMFIDLLGKEKVLSNFSVKYYSSYKQNNKNYLEFINIVNPKIENKYIKVFYKKKKVFKVHWYNQNKLIKNVNLNEKGQVIKVIDFKFLNTKEYKYNANSIDEIECLYLKGICSVREVEIE